MYLAMQYVINQSINQSIPRLTPHRISLVFLIDSPANNTCIGIRQLGAEPGLVFICRGDCRREKLYLNR